MQTDRFGPTISVTALAVMSLILLIPKFPARADSENSLGSDSIIGSWHVTVSFDDGRPDVLALYTFDRDRNFVMDGSWPGLFGSGHGSWNRDTAAANPSLNVTFFRLLYLPTEMNEATGALNATFNGTLKVQAKLTVGDDGNSFSGRYLLTSFDPNGKVRSTATGNLNAGRVAIDPVQ